MISADMSEKMEELSGMGGSFPGDGDEILEELDKSIERYKVLADSDDLYDL